MTSNRHIVDQYAEVEAKLKELSDQKKALREKILSRMGSRFHSLSGDEHVIVRTESSRVGPIDPKQLEARGINPDEFRKPDVSVTKLSIEDLVKSNAA